MQADSPRAEEEFGTPMLYEGRNRRYYREVEREDLKEARRAGTRQKRGSWREDRSRGKAFPGPGSGNTWFDGDARRR